MPVVTPDASMNAVRRALRIAPAVVVMDEKKCVGLLTPRDIAVESDAPARACVAERPVVDIDEEIGTVLETMRSAGSTVLPVFAGGRFYGVVYEGDIADALLRYRAELEREVGHYTARLSTVNGNLHSAAREHRRTERALRESEQRCRELTDLLPQPVFETDLKGTFTFANRAAFELFGYEARDLAQGVNVASLVVPADRPRAARNLERRLRGIKEDIHYTALSKDGRTFPVIIRSDVIRRGAEVIGFRGVVIDITEIQKVERELWEERLKNQKLESIGVLAAGIAHDFNNILAAILGNISLARQDATDERCRHEVLAEAERAALRAAELTAHLGTFAKGGAPTTKPTSLARLIHDSADFALHGSSTKCHFHIPEALWTAEVDPRQIGQVVSNLVINAVQAMHGRGQISVGGTNETITDPTVLDLPPGRYVRIFVTDRGEGIKPHHRTKIFDPYFTTKPTGSGLGLAICHSVVKRHGGAIDVRSDPADGTTFSVYLPATDRPPHREQTADSSRPVPTTTRSGKILLMDDQPSLRRMGTVMLERLGFDADCAEDGAEAVAMYSRAIEEGAPYRAVVLDLTVPGGIGGHEALDTLLDIDPHITALASSGYSDTLTLARYREYGFTAILPKPYTLAELRQALTDALG
jgi:PAS domain S-box-containing protein